MFVRFVSRLALVALQLNYFSPMEMSDYISDDVMSFDNSCHVNNGVVVMSRKMLQLLYCLVTLSGASKLDWQDIPSIVTALCEHGQITDVLTFLCLFQDWRKYEKRAEFDSDDRLSCCLRAFSEISVNNTIESILRSSNIPNDYAFKSVCIVNQTDIHHQQLVWYQHLVDMIVTVKDVELNQKLKSRFALICSPSPLFNYFLSQSCGQSQLVRHLMAQDRVTEVCNFTEYLLSSDCCVSYESIDLLLMYLLKNNYRKEYELLLHKLRISFRNQALLEYA